MVRSIAFAAVGALIAAGVGYATTQTGWREIVAMWIDWMPHGSDTARATEEWPICRISRARKHWRPVIGTAPWLTRDQANVFQHDQVFFGLRVIAQCQIQFAQMLVSTAVAAVKRQRLLIMLHRRPQFAQPSISVPDIIMDVGVARIA
jgi:hypothetical protein